MTASEIRVSPDWLALREPRRRRRPAPPTSSSAPRRPAGDRPPGDPRPRLRHRVDGPLARAAAPGAAALGAARPGRRPARRRRRRPPRPGRGRRRGHVEPRRSDITRLRPDDLAGATLITASALLDLLTADELARLVDVCAAAGCPALLTLSVVGESSSRPPTRSTRASAPPSTPTSAARRRGGRLLGPDAVAAAVEAFGRLRGRGLVRPSPWRLGAAEAELAAEWLDRLGRRRVRAGAGAAPPRPTHTPADGWPRHAPGSSRSPSATPTCWSCRDHRHR